MKENKTTNLADLIDVSDIKDIFSHVKFLFCLHYEKKYYKEMLSCYKKIEDLFSGKFKGYNACKTRYHNFHHTMNVVLACARLLDGYNSDPEIGDKLSPELAVNLIRAALFHDTGYIQEKWDNEGTGAKYTENHVGRSIAFVVKNRIEFAIEREDVDVISKMIRCTDMKCNLSTIPFSSEEEKTAGMILGTADILGQMSDREYLERLLFLYNEMKEAGIPGYNTEFDIIKGTLVFYDTIKKRLNNLFRKVYSYAQQYFNVRYGIDSNLYMDAVESNIMYIEKIIKDSSTNFRHKLKRGKIFNDREILLASEAR